MSSLKAKVIQGTAWIVGFRLGQRLLGLISTLILVRLLSPQDFGLVAMGMAVAAVFSALSSLGFDQTLIQRREVDRRHLDTAWTINQIVSVAAATMLLFAAPTVATYYKDDRVIPVLAVVALSTALSGVHNFVGMTLHERDFRFGPVFALTMGSRLIATVVTLITALALRDYRALLAGMATLAISRTALGFVLSPYRPRWSLIAAGEMLTFAKWLLVNNVISAIASRGQDALVGRTLGADAAGNFSVANEVASLPTTELVLPFMRAIYPAYVKMRDQGGRLLQGFEPTLSVVLILVLPAAAGIATVSDLLVLVGLGKKWIAAGPMLQILVVLGALQSARAVIDPVFLAVGKPWMLASVSAIFVAVGFPAFFILLGTFGLPAAAWGLVLGGLVSFVIGVAACLYELQGHWTILLRTVIRPALATVIMVGLLTLLRDAFDPSPEVAAATGQLLALVVAGALTYAGAILSLWKMSGSPASAEHRILELTGAMLLRVRRKLTGS